MPNPPLTRDLILDGTYGEARVHFWFLGTCNPVHKIDLSTFEMMQTRGRFKMNLEKAYVYPT
jgi:hypothetical protein